jgi:glycosyltransferase involved in cell wall biosynthesis
LNICLANSINRSAVDTIVLDGHIRLLEPLCDNLYVIAADLNKKYTSKVHVVGIEKIGWASSQNLLGRMKENFVSQFKLIINIARYSKNFEAIIFDIGEYRNLIAVIFSKFLFKKTAVFHRSSNKLLEAKFEYQSGLNGIIIPSAQESMLKACYAITDYVLCESPSIIASGNLTKYSKKVLFYSNFVDMERFSMTTLPSEKDNLVGYIGRLSPKKGIINLIKAIPQILESCPTAKFVIIGEGTVREELEIKVKEYGLEDKVTFVHWLPESEFAEALASMKLFVLPSYEEGVPITALQAMACGTIVVATRVGGIPDLVSDKQTGFILTNNKPKTIATCISEALKAVSLDTIAVRGNRLIEKEYSLGPVKKKWQSMLKNFDEDSDVRLKK